MNNKAYVRLINSESGNLVGYANVTINGIRINGIKIKLKKDGVNTYNEWPCSLRKKGDEYVKDESGYAIRDYYAQPASKEVAAEVDKLIDEALAAEFEKIQG